MGLSTTDVHVAPLAIGPLVVDPPVVLAPMAGVTDVVFRRLCRHSGPGLFVCEMITARALVEQNERTLAMVAFDPDEQPRSAQLYGVDPTTIGEAVRRLVGDHGVDHVDLNFGCPVPKVTRRGGGAALPVHRALLREIVRAAVCAAEDAGRVPVTMKFRIGIDERVTTFLDSGRIAEDEGCATVALHARTAEQRYAGSARWDAIGELKAAVTSIPVLGNGDIWEPGDAVAMMAATGCDGVVVGRGCLGRPWLFRDLAAAMTGQVPSPSPTLGQVMAVIRDHAQMLVEAFGEHRGIRRLRKHVGWYLAGYPVGPAARRELALAENLVAFAARLDQLDPTITLPPGGERLPRGHTHGPHPVALPDGWLDSVDDPTPPAGAELLISGG